MRMDNNWDALAYIILSIIIFAVSAFRKKKKPVLTSAEGENESKGIFDLLNEVVEPIKENEQKKVSENQFLTNQEKKQAPQINKIYSKEEQKRTSEVSDSTDEIEKIEYEEFELEEFDLKQAVIYSEILNRKTF